MGKRVTQNLETDKFRVMFNHERGKGGIAYNEAILILM